MNRTVDDGRRMAEKEGQIVAKIERIQVSIKNSENEYWERETFVFTTLEEFIKELRYWILKRLYF